MYKEITPSRMLGRTYILPRIGFFLFTKMKKGVPQGQNSYDLLGQPPSLSNRTGSFPSYGFLNLVTGTAPMPSLALFLLDGSLSALECEG